MIPVLTTASSVTCPHGGTVTLTTANTVVQVDGAYALLQSDVHSVVGCPFTLPNGTPQPCMTVQWTSGATQNKVNQVAVLLQTSSGLCFSATGIPQGAPIVTQAQAKGTGQ